MMQQVDVIIVGAGPAGMSAALAAHQAGYSLILLEKSMPGGKLNTYQTLEGFPGYEHVSAQQFGLDLYDALTKKDIQTTYGDVQSIEKKGDRFIVTADTGTYQSFAVIMATGTKEKPLTIPGAEALFGQGVSYCAACDGGFFKDKDVAVIGSDLHAMEEAIFLANICHHIYVLIPQPGLAPKNWLVKLNQLANVTIIEGATPLQVMGQDAVTGLRYQTVIHGEQDILLDGIFPILGWVPNFQPLQAFQTLLDQDGFGLANREGVSKIPGLFIIGDLQAKALRRVKNVISQGQLVVKELANVIKR
jgi:thioredoxin reductase (NADPH)